jgi:hypothetical protein
MMPAAKGRMLPAVQPPYAGLPLAAPFDLAENSRQGVERKNAALHLKREVCNSTIALGMRAGLLQDRIGSRIQTWNRYAYVTNNPTSFTDPTGLVSIPNVGDYFGGGGGGFNCTQDGVDQSCNTVYSVLQGGGAVVCPNNNCAPQWNGSAWTYFSAFADGTQGYYQMGMAPQQNSLLGVPASGDPATAACIAKGLQSAFPGSTVSAGASTDEVGGHWNFYVTLQFPSQSAFNAFDSTYDSASNGWPPPARFGDGPALHLENLGNFGDGTFGVVGTAHIDLFNPDTGIGGIAGHVGDDVVWGHIVQFFGGNIDPKACPFQ